MFLGWLRKNCMEVFHWVALELKDTPIFSVPMQEKKKEGAYYNDFDNANPFSSDDSDELEFSFTQPTSSQRTVEAARPGSSHSSNPKSFEDLLDETYYMLENFDRYSPNPDKEYRKKVYNLMIESQSVRIEIPPQIQRKYQQRYAMDWAGADTVYDMFLLGAQKQRSWFPQEVFEAEYPDYQSIVNEIVDERSSDNASTTDEEDEQQRNETTNRSDKASTTDEEILQTRSGKGPLKKRARLDSISSTTDEEDELQRNETTNRSDKASTTDEEMVQTHSGKGPLKKRARLDSSSSDKEIEVKKSDAVIKIEVTDSAISSTDSDANATTPSKKKKRKQSVKMFTPKHSIEEVIIISD